MPGADGAYGLAYGAIKVRSTIAIRSATVQCMALRERAVLICRMGLPERDGTYYWLWHTPSYAASLYEPLPSYGY